MDLSFFYDWLIRWRIYSVWKEIKNEYLSQADVQSSVYKLVLLRRCAKSLSQSDAFIGVSFVPSVSIAA